MSTQQTVNIWNIEAKLYWPGLKFSNDNRTVTISEPFSSANGFLMHKLSDLDNITDVNFEINQVFAESLTMVYIGIMEYPVKTKYNPHRLVSAQNEMTFQLKMPKFSIPTVNFTARREGKWLQRLKFPSKFIWGIGDVFRFRINKKKKLLQLFRISNRQQTVNFFKYNRNSEERLYEALPYEFIVGAWTESVIKKFTVTLL